MSTNTQTQNESAAPTKLSQAGAEAVAQSALLNHPEDGGAQITYTDKTISAVSNAFYQEYGESTAGGMMSATGEMMGGFGDTAQGWMGKLGKKWPWLAVLAMAGLAIANMTGFSGFMGIVVGLAVAAIAIIGGAFDGGSRSDNFMGASAGGPERSQDRAMNVHQRILSSSPDELGYGKAELVEEAVRRAGGNQQALANDPAILEFAAWRNEVAARASGYRMMNGVMVPFSAGRGRSTGAIAFEMGAEGNGTELGSSEKIVHNEEAIRQALERGIVIADGEYGIQPAPVRNASPARQR